MRRRAIALIGTAATAATLLAAAPVAAEETAVPAPALDAALERAGAGLGDVPVDLGEAVAVPLSATTTNEDGEFTVMDGEIPYGSCGGIWSWDYTEAGDYWLDLTYGLTADCNFPAYGYPETDIGTEARLHPLDEFHSGDSAPSGHGGLGTPSESVELVQRSWPSSWRMSGEMSILLLSTNPEELWVWGAVPDGCDGTGTFLLYCQLETEELHIGNLPCGSADSYAESGGSMDAEFGCSGSLTGSITDTAHDGDCAYAMAALANGEVLWKGVCDGGGTVDFDWNAPGRVVHTWVYVG